MAGELGHRVSCDLHSGCHAMMLTAGFYGDSGLILLGKIEWSNTGMFIVKSRQLFKNIVKKRNGDGTSFRTRGFGENLDDFWPRL